VSQTIPAVLARRRRQRVRIPRLVARVLAAAVSVTGALTVAGCERATSAPTPNPTATSARPTAPATPVEDLAQNLDDANAPPPVWPDALPSLDADLARRESAGACAERIRNTLLPEVAEAIASMGYDHFVADLCGALAAIRAGDVAACDALSLSAARMSCRRRLALVHRRPEACPDDLSVSGREPVCLAWATREPALCRGATVGERTRCEAVFAGDPQRCRGLPSVLQTRCKSDVARLGPTLGDARTVTAAPVSDTDLALTLTYADPQSAAATGADDSGASAAPDAIDAGSPAAVSIASPTLERGVVAARCADGVRIRVGDPRRRGSPAMLDGPPVAELLLRLPADAPRGPLRLRAGALDVRLRVRIPRVGEGTSDDDRRGEVVLDAHEIRRGATLAGRVRLTVTLDGEPARVEGRFSTFLRDIVDSDAPECAF